MERGYGALKLYQSATLDSLTSPALFVDVRDGIGKLTTFSSVCHPRKFPPALPSPDIRSLSIVCFAEDNNNTDRDDNNNNNNVDRFTRWPHCWTKAIRDVHTCFSHPGKGSRIATQY